MTRDDFGLQRINGMTRDNWDDWKLLGMNGMTGDGGGD